MSSNPILVEITKNEKSQKINVRYPNEPRGKRAKLPHPIHTFVLDIPENPKERKNRINLEYEIIKLFDKGIKKQLIFEILNAIYSKLGSGKINHKTVGTDLSFLISKNLLKRVGKKGIITLNEMSSEDMMKILQKPKIRNSIPNEMSASFDISFRGPLKLICHLKVPRSDENKSHKIEVCASESYPIFKEVFELFLKRWVQSFYVSKLYRPSSLFGFQYPDLRNSLKGKSFATVEIDNYNIDDKFIKQAVSELDFLKINGINLVDAVNGLKFCINEIDKRGGEITREELYDLLDKNFPKEKIWIRVLLKDYCDSIKLQEGKISLIQSGKKLIEYIDDVMKHSK